MEKFNNEDHTHRALAIIHILSVYALEVAIAAIVVSKQALTCPWPVRALATTLALAVVWNVNRHEHERSEKALEGTLQREFKDREQETAFRAHIARAALCWRARYTSVIGLVAMMSWANHTFPFWHWIAISAGGVVAWIVFDQLVIKPRLPTSAITDKPGHLPDIRPAQP